MSKKQDVFIILSVIKHSQDKLSYSNTRSIFNENDRILQTKKTIESIRTYAPHAKIYFIEAGKENYAHLFEKMSDSYLFLGNKKLIRLCVDSKFKGLGEASILTYTQNLMKKEKNTLIFKLSGRYFLDENFNRKQFENDKLNFKINQESLSTRLYAIPQKKWSVFILINILSIPVLLLGTSIERVYYFFIYKIRVDIHKMHTLGVSGYIAVNGEIINE